MAEGISLYDKFGPYFTLLRTDPTVDVTALIDAAERRRLPLAVLDIGTHDAKEAYSHKLTLVRPDQHVAWRGDEPPTMALQLIDLVRGAATSLTRLDYSLDEAGVGRTADPCSPGIRQGPIGAP